MNQPRNPIVGMLIHLVANPNLSIKVKARENEMRELLFSPHSPLKTVYNTEEGFRKLTGPEGTTEYVLDDYGVFSKINPDGTFTSLFIINRDAQGISEIQYYVKPVITQSVTWNNESNGENTNPLEQFSIKEILSLNFLDSINFSLTNFGLYLLLASIIILALFFLSNNYDRIKSNEWSGGQESLYSTLYGIVINQINDKKGQMFFPFIFTIFVFILCCNLIGMVPYNFASTSHFIYTFSLSFTIVIGATLLAVAFHQLRLFSLFVPQGCPIALLVLLVLIEFISYIARNISLGLRLAANILSGHMLLNILSGFTYKIMNSGYIYLIIGGLPLAFIIAFSGLEVGIAFIQAQVFAVLSSSYIKDGFLLH